MRIEQQVNQAFVPPERQTMSEWCQANVRVPAELETPGPFDIGLFPHVEGVFEACDDHNVKEIYLRWATRNAKTFTSLSALICLVSTTGRSGMVASANENRVDDLIDTEIYPILEDCDETRAKLVKPHLRNRQLGIVIGQARIRKGYVGSKTALAGFAACYGLANEVGLWSVNSVNRFRQRSRLYPFHRKLIFEGKPENAGECTISYLCDSKGTQRRFREVPCPHCGAYQRLVWGDSDDNSPGVKWDSKSKAAPEHTAFYRCVSGCEIRDPERMQMMRAGVWVPEGMTVADSGTLEGTPDVESPNVAFDELSALYSLAIGGWGSLVREWLECQSDEDAIREFVTGTLARPYAREKRETSTEAVAARLQSNEPMGTVPEWGVFLTAAYDVQTQATGYEYPWGVCAWGADGRGHLVDYGVAYGEAEVAAALTKGLRYPHADGHQPLASALTGIDSSDGNVAAEVYDLCRRFRLTLPIKGLSTSISEFYKLTQLGNQKRRKVKISSEDRIRRGETMLVGVDSDKSQGWIQRHLDGRTNEDSPGRFTLCSEAAMDESLLIELLNEIGQSYNDPRTNQRRNRWVRVDPNQPNDFRDVIRYCWVLAQVVTKQGTKWGSLPPRQIAPPPKTRPKSRQKKQPEILSGGGRQWR